MFPVQTTRRCSAKPHPDRWRAPVSARRLVAESITPSRRVRVAGQRQFGPAATYPRWSSHQPAAGQADAYEFDTCWGWMKTLASWFGGGVEPQVRRLLANSRFQSSTSTRSGVSVLPAADRWA